MKMLVQKVRSLVWILLVGLWLLPNDSQAQQAEVSFQVFMMNRRLTADGLRTLSMAMYGRPM